MKKNKDIILEEILAEVSMSPSALRKAVEKIPNAKAGLEFELIVTSLEEEEDDDYDPYEDFESEPDYDTDERIDISSWDRLERDLQNFFRGDHNSRREVQRAYDLMREAWTEWLETQWDTYAGDNIQDFIDKRYGRDYASQEELFKEMDAIDPYAAFRKEYYQTWVDNIEDDANLDDNLELFLDDTYGGGMMSDLAHDSNLGLSWPNWTEPDYDNRRTRSTIDVGDFRRAVGIKTIKSGSYHGINKPMDAYVVEPDSSLKGSSGKGGSGLEFVSPPLSIPEMIDQIKKVKAWAKAGNAYTNTSTGLHMNISIPGYKLDKLDFVKLALFLGDKYILDKFGRLGNYYAKSAFDQIASFIKQNPKKADQAVDAMRQNLNSVASKLIHNGYTDKFTSINTKDNRVEFRSPGGNWLEMDTDAVVNTLLRVVYAMNIALHPEMERKEYQKKFAKLLTADKKDETDTIKYFTAFASGNLPRTALVSYIKNAQEKRDFSKAATAPLPRASEPNEPEGTWQYSDYTGPDAIKFYIVSRNTGAAMQSFSVSPRISLNDVFDIATRIWQATGYSFDRFALRNARNGQEYDILQRREIPSSSGQQAATTQPSTSTIPEMPNQVEDGQLYQMMGRGERVLAQGKFNGIVNAIQSAREYAARNNIRHEDYHIHRPNVQVSPSSPAAAQQSQEHQMFEIVSDGSVLHRFVAPSQPSAYQYAVQYANTHGLINGRWTWRTADGASQEPRQYSQIELDRGYDMGGRPIPQSARQPANITATEGVKYQIIANGAVVHEFNAASPRGAERYAESWANEHLGAVGYRVELAPRDDLRDITPEIAGTDESLEESILNEINMGKSALEKFADTPFAKSMKVGFETEMYIPGLGSGEDGGEEEEDMDEDEDFPRDATYRDLQQDVINFFNSNYANDRSNIESALEELYEAYSEYEDEQFYNFKDTKEYKDELVDRLGKPEDEASEREIDDANDELRDEWINDNSEDIFRKFLKRNLIRTMHDWMEWVNRESPRITLNWPHMRTVRGESTVDIEDVVEDFKNTTGYGAKASTGYHGASRDESTWIFEPDSSLDSPYESEDGGIELVSPPMNLEDGLAALENVFTWAKSNDYYTNRSTGFHIGVSIPLQTMENIDHLKVIMLLGDEYVLKAFGRANSRWTKSSFEQAKREVRGRAARKNVPAILDKMRGGMQDIAKQEINKLLVPRGDRYVSVNIKPNYIEFRSAGGDYFEKYEEIRKTMLRYVRVIGAAADSEDARQEYQKKLYKFVSAGIGEKDNTMQLFAKYTSGDIDKETLIKELRDVQERRKPATPLGSGPVDGFLEDQNGEQVVKINGNNPYEMIDLAVRFADTRQIPLTDVNLRYPGYSIVRVQYFSTDNQMDSKALVFVPGIELYTTYKSEILEKAIPVVEKHWNVKGLRSDRFDVQVLDEYSLQYLRDDVRRITARGEDRAPSTSPTAPRSGPTGAAPSTTPSGASRYVIRYTDDGSEVHRFGAHDPEIAKRQANDFQRAYSTVMRWGGTIGRVRGIALYTIAPNTDEEELFYMGPSEPIVNQSPEESPEPYQHRAGAPTIRNPGGRGVYALFVSDGTQMSMDTEFNSYQDALRHFTPLANDSGLTGWSVRQLMS